MKKFFSKFRFLIWSWEFDILKIFPYLFLFISFLPILPYKNKEGKLSSVLGKEASVENFYDLGIKSLDSIIGINKEKQSYIPKKGGAFYELNKLYEQPIPSPLGQRKFLQRKGYEKQLIDCIVMRDFFSYIYFNDSETRYLLDNYPTSPVPIIWLARLIIKEVFFLLIIF